MDEAESLLSRAALAGAAYEGTEQQTKVQWAYGRVLAKNGKLKAALDPYRRSTDAVDRLFAQTRGIDEDTRQGYAARFSPLYFEMTELLLRLHAAEPSGGFDREALALVSRTQSRIFSEMLRKADAGHFVTDPEFKNLRSRQQQLRESVAQWRRKRSAAADDNLERDEEPENGTSQRVQDPYIRARMVAARDRAAQAMQAAEADLAKVEDELWKKYPRYMELTQPRPVTVDTLQRTLLKPGETLVTYSLLPGRSIAFIITRERFRLVELPLGRAEIAALVTAARPPEDVGRSIVEQLARLDPSVLHRLYRAVFEPLASNLAGAERLLVVPDGALHTLPFEMLVTRWDEADQRKFSDARGKAPLLGEYSGLAYLGERHRFAYLPSLAALSSMRLYRKPAVRHDRELVSFADPVFDAPGTAPARPMLAAISRSARPSASGAIEIPRLPDTADEAREIAAVLGGKSSLFLRGQAQEHTAKTLDLKTTRFVHFATHGLLGGEFTQVRAAVTSEGATAGAQRNLVAAARPLELAWDQRAPAAAPSDAEPALVLSLSGDLKGEDGLLTMNEIVASMDLNARLVVLSACNTAGEGAEATNGEGFAGLTRAFMYAGAQALLVSHWAVESRSTRELMVEFFRELHKGTEAGAALRGARQRVRSSALDGTIARGHPYFWAPFVYVGD